MKAARIISQLIVLSLLPLVSGGANAGESPSSRKETPGSDPACNGSCACNAGVAGNDGQGTANATPVVSVTSPSADKNLSPDWVRSLFERGRPAVLQGDELNWVGMPVGGICAGQLYLGGDGRLWLWDIFNQTEGYGADHYAHPAVPASPLEQGFTLRIGERVIPLDRTGFPKVTFLGQYPVGTVRYEDATVPASVTLEAFSPFIPLNTDDSSLPATVMRFTVKNTSAAPLEATLAGRLENAVCLKHRIGYSAIRKNRIVAGEGFTFLDGTVEEGEYGAKRPDILFEDWHTPVYEGWTTEGAAFGLGSVMRTNLPRNVGGDTPRLVNSFLSAKRNNRATGKLVSRAFTIERNLIWFWIGGGNKPGRTCLNLVIDGKIVRTATGKNSFALEHTLFDVAEFAGKTAHFEIVDADEGEWGHVGVGRIVFADRSFSGPIKNLTDYGSMGLALLGSPADKTSGNADAPIAAKLTGELQRTLKLAPGESATVDYVLTWYFPNLYMGKKRHYSVTFDSALAVGRYVAGNVQRLAGQTLLWRDTWYDSTLPYWFLDRTFLNTSTLASSTCHRYQDGRFYAFEGVACCAGTCGHVWHYAQAMGRQFPELERILRERVDFGLAMKPDGAIRFRGENNDMPAMDAQAGVILRTLREHQMSADDAFLRRVWPGAKKATQWLLAQDPAQEGLQRGKQHNTLDTDWYGPVSWLSGLYIAALQAAAEMADDMQDTEFAGTCRRVAANGREKMVKDLFNGEYFINQPDPQHPDTVNSGTGCEIDQVIGQSWAFQVGLPRVLPEMETVAALKSLWRYNFCTDVGPYREKYKAGRWYALAGEAGLIMCTFPKPDWTYEQSRGTGKSAGFAGYFNECMNGFEHQVAGHMIWEGLVMEGLAIERAVHDRYHPAKRNPWNEIECGDHYARSMASYGVFLAACGFEYHGPKGHIGFAPRLTPENFKAAFTSAEGWGTFEQHLAGDRQEAAIHLKYGSLNLRTLALAALGSVGRASATLNGKPLETSLDVEGKRLTLKFPAGTRLNAKDMLKITILP